MRLRRKLEKEEITAWAMLGVTIVILSVAMLFTLPQLSYAKEKPTRREERLELRKRIDAGEIPDPLKQTTTPPAQPKQLHPLGVWHLSRYYSPVPGQPKYLNGWKRGYKRCPSCYKSMTWRAGNGDFLAEKYMNGDLSAADGTDLSVIQPGTVVACPSNIAFGTKLLLEGYGEVTCVDRGGAIKGSRLDLWVGVGEDGYANYVNNVFPTGKFNVFKVL